MGRLAPRHPNRMEHEVTEHGIRQVLRDWDMVTTEAEDEALEPVADEIQSHIDAALRAMCRVLGHTPVQDHCGKPEHDCCAWCDTLTPGEAPR